MRYSKLIYLLSILTTAITLFLAYSLERFWLGFLIAVGLVFLGWLGWKKHKWFWSSELFFASVIFLVIIGSLFGLRMYLLFPALLGAMAAWDTGRLQQRLKGEPSSEIIVHMEKRHLILLALALSCGGIFTTLLMTIQVQLSFNVVLALSVILIISVSYIFRSLRN